VVEAHLFLTGIFQKMGPVSPPRAAKRSQATPKVDTHR